MKFYSVWLIVLTMLVGTASAANVNFNGGSVGNCTLSSNTYSCTSSFALGASDFAVIASGYTVVMNANFAPAYNQGLTMSGSAVLQTSGTNNIDLSSSNNISVSGGTITTGGNFKLGSNPQSITANINAATITTAGSSTSITGTVIASGAINFGSSTTINGPVTAASISTGSSNTITGNVTATGAINTGSSTTINGSVNSASISTASSTTITGSLVVTGLADLGSAIKINGSVTANAVQTGSPGNIGGAIISTTTVSMGSGLVVGGNVSGTTITSTSPVTVNGNVNATTSFTLASGSSVTGNVTAPVVTLSASNSTVKGNIDASTSLDIGSGVTVTGTVKGGSLTMRPSNSVINGSVTMTGDVDMGSGTTINGDLSARNVTTHSSNAVINGNAAVNAIYIDYNNSVTKTITCTGAGASGCSCVTKADPNYHPTCGAPPSAGPHHIQISHTGTALTCQPQTVTLTACANANCTAPHFTSNVDVTTSPGNKVFTVSGGVNSAATVQSTAVGTFSLGAAASSASNATICVNTASGASNSTSACDMTFATAGLTMSSANHVSLADNVAVTIQALTASAGNQSCVPLVTNQTVNVNMSCKFSNPINAADVPVKLDENPITCGKGAFGTSASMPFKFDVNGIATVPLKYADVGQVGLNASLASGGFTAAGTGSFIAAPKELRVTATSATAAIGPATASPVPATVFAKASEKFKLSITAVNSLGDATKNFGQESPPSKVTLALTVNDPSFVPGITATKLGQFAANFSAFTGGISTATDASFDDVGYLKIEPSLVDNIYYLGYQDDKFKTAGTQYVSRFIPDHFNVILLDNTDQDVPQTPKTGHRLSCIGMPVSTNPCGINGPTNSFIHAQQPFYLKVEAYNGSTPTALLKNYNGTLVQVIDLFAAATLGGDVPDDPVAGMANWTTGAQRFTFPAADNAPLREYAGIGKLSGASMPSFNFKAPYPQPNVPVNFYLRAKDTDGASSKRSTASASVEPLLTIVSGRMLVSNNYGSPKSRLPVKVYAQYYMPNGYVFNPLVNDISNSSVSSFFNYGNCQKALDISGNNSHTCRDTTTNTFKLTNPSAGMELRDGIGTFIMEPPAMTFNGIGSVDVTLTKTTNKNSVIIYLPSTTGRETFGIYRSGPVIYTREQY